MLAELAAANAAFAVIKSAVMNGKSIADVATKVSDYVNATEDLRKMGEKKKRSPFKNADLEEFMHLEKLREQEEELKQLMIYTGRPGLWGDWQRFQAEARKARIQAAEDKKRKITEIVEMGGIILLALILATVVIGFFWWIWILKEK